MVSLIFKITLILGSLLSVGCSSLFYYPDQINTYVTPDRIGLKAEDVWIKVNDELQIHGWWISSSRPSSLGTVVYFHGNAENISSHFLNLAWLPSEGFNYFIFDYPGYGQSNGKPGPEINVAASIQALKWVRQNKDQRPLFLFGQSLGGNIALRTAEEVYKDIPLAGIAIDCSFYSYQSIARGKLAGVWITWPIQHISYLLLSDKWAPKNLGQLSPIPVIFFHGQKDRVVEPEFGDDLFNRAAEPKQIIRIQDGQHGDLFWAHDLQYRKVFYDWLLQNKK